MMYKSASASKAAGALDAADAAAPVVTFRVWAGTCGVRADMEVVPETVVGSDAITGEPVTAGCYGRVQGLRTNDSAYVLIVEIRPHAPKAQRIGPDILLFKVNGASCQLLVGDPVTPNTVIGRDRVTGMPLRAGCHGYIEVIDPLQEHDALMVLVKETIAPHIPTPRPVMYKIRGGRSGLQVGDRIKPETPLGRDFETNEIVYTQVGGSIKGIRMNPAEQSMLIMVSQDGS